MFERAWDGGQDCTVKIATESVNPCSCLKHDGEMTGRQYSSGVYQSSSLNVP